VCEDETQWRNLKRGRRRGEANGNDDACGAESGGWVRLNVEEEKELSAAKFHWPCTVTIRLSPSSACIFIFTFQSPQTKGLHSFLHYLFIYSGFISFYCFDLFTLLALKQLLLAVVGFTPTRCVLVRVVCNGGTIFAPCLMAITFVTRSLATVFLFFSFFVVSYIILNVPILLMHICYVLCFSRL